MDNRMIDSEDRRDDRRNMTPNRQARRLMAKRVGVFKKKYHSSWKYLNSRNRPNQPIRHNDPEVKL